MKPKSTLRAALAWAGFVLTVPHLVAADLTWDESTAAGIQVPATGTWTGTGAGWSTNGTTLVNWAAANVAVFGGADGTYGVTVGGSFSAQKISFVNSGYTLSGTSARVITLTATSGGVNLPQLAVIGGKSSTIGSNVTVNAQQTFYIGAAGSNAGGTLNIEGGTVGTSTNAGSSVVIDGAGTIVNVKTGGTLRLLNTGNSNSNAAIVVGQLANSNASLNVDGGSVLVNQGNSSGTGGFLVGNIGQGTVTLTSGTIDVLATAPLGVTFGNNVASAGANALHLDGGILTTSTVRKGAGTATATFNFNGGTLRANASSTAFMQGLTTANVKSGGAMIDTQANNITINQALLEDSSSPGGGLTKTGSGTLTLGGANTYTGTTTISAGTLSLGAANVLPDASALVLGGGVLATGQTFNETAKSLSLTSASTITMGLDTGTSILTFTGGVAGTSGISTSTVLSIWNWNGSLSGGGDDRLILPAGSLNPTELAGINFYSGAGTGLIQGGGALQLGTGELVPVPEPGALALGLTIAGGMLFRRRRPA